jgi:hypothetical protein
VLLEASWDSFVDEVWVVTVPEPVAKVPSPPPPRSPRAPPSSPSPRCLWDTLAPFRSPVPALPPTLVPFFSTLLPSSLILPPWRMTPSLTQLMTPSLTQLMIPYSPPSLAHHPPTHPLRSSHSPSPSPPPKRVCKTCIHAKNCSNASWRATAL